MKLDDLIAALIAKRSQMPGDTEVKAPCGHSDPGVTPITGLIELDDGNLLVDFDPDTWEEYPYDEAKDPMVQADPWVVKKDHCTINGAVCDHCGEPLWSPHGERCPAVPEDVRNG